MSAGELTPFELHGMHPVLAVSDINETLAFYRDKLGFHVDFVHGDPPVHARGVRGPDLFLSDRSHPLRAARTWGLTESLCLSLDSRWYRP